MTQSMHKLQWIVGCNACTPGMPKTQFIRVHLFCQDIVREFCSAPASVFGSSSKTNPGLLCS